MSQESDLSVPKGLVGGKYQLIRLLGRGGMGAVWEATHASLGTHVAVKFIDAEFAKSPEARSRFDNEARAAAKLRSKHVVEIYDHGVSDDGRPFIVMEFLQGEPLDKRLDRVGRLPAKETARIIQQVARALTKAHAAGIVHRDLKPENVFLVRDEEEGTDEVKVVDFGIAKFTDLSMASASSTRTGSVLGTPHYMSPEQARGLRNLDFRSDLWSVAVIAYRCIVGVLPFDGEAVGDLLVKVCTAPIPMPSQIVPDIPPGFDAWLARALEREPARRFASATELADSLALTCGLSVRAAGIHADLHSRAGWQPPSSTVDGRLALELSTGAPITNTSGAAPRTSTGALLAAGLVALVVLGIGGAVAFKKLSARGPADGVQTGSSGVTVPSVSANPLGLRVGPASAVGSEVEWAASAAAPVGSAPTPKPTRTSSPTVLRPTPKAVAPRPVTPRPAAPKKDSDIGF